MWKAILKKGREGEGKGELCGDVGWGGMSHQLRGVIVSEV